MRVNPCRECKVHTSICKLLCKDYKEWKAEDLERKKIASNVRRIQGELANQQVTSKDKQNRKRGYKKW